MPAPRAAIILLAKWALASRPAEKLSWKAALREYASAAQFGVDFEVLLPPVVLL